MVKPQGLIHCIFSMKTKDGFLLTLQDQEKIRMRRETLESFTNSPVESSYIQVSVPEYKLK